MNRQLFYTFVILFFFYLTTTNFYLKKLTVSKKTSPKKSVISKSVEPKSVDSLHPNVLIFNAVQKTGSTTFHQLLLRLRSQNGFFSQHLPCSNRNASRQKNQDQQVNWKLKFNYGLRNRI